MNAGKMELNFSFSEDKVVARIESFEGENHAPFGLAVAGFCHHQGWPLKYPHQQSQWNPKQILKPDRAINNFLTSEAGFFESIKDRHDAGHLRVSFARTVKDGKAFEGAKEQITEAVTNRPVIVMGDEKQTLLSEDTADIAKKLKMIAEANNAADAGDQIIIPTGDRILGHIEAVELKVSGSNVASNVDTDGLQLWIFFFNEAQPLALAAGEIENFPAAGEHV